MKMKRRIVVVGAGPAGVAAAIGAKQQGIGDVLLIERDSKTGGILNQCIHEGFGLIKFGEVLTGTEYAYRNRQELEKEKIEIMLNAMVLSLNGNKELVVASRRGIIIIEAESIVFATGCRERTRGALAIPGGRPAGVYTAGTVQNLINLKNIMPGYNVVILGSGDIGLIMARRLTLEGAKVQAVIEIKSDSGGLERNISQCLYDFDIPLYLQHTVTKINGQKRIESIEISEVDGSGNPINGTEKQFECDTLILSVGLIPENEVLKTAGAKMDESFISPIIDDFYQTSISGVFVCGNARKVLDLADFVSSEGEEVGKNAARYVHKEDMIIVNKHQGNNLPKGVPAKDSLTCIVCPRGCKIKCIKGERGIEIEGNQCDRGRQYAEQELIEPKRCLTTTVKCVDGSLVPVKSTKAIRLEELKQVVQKLNNEVVVKPDTLKHGTIVYEEEGYGRFIATNNG